MTYKLYCDSCGELICEGAHPNMFDSRKFKAHKIADRVFGTSNRVYHLCSTCHIKAESFVNRAKIRGRE